MALINFQKRFVPKILAGEKTHTIRAWRKHPVKVGETLHLYTGLRQRGARLLMRVPCTKALPITLSRGNEWMYSQGEHVIRPQIEIAGSLLALDEMEALAVRDGFASLFEMASFWDLNKPFSGQIIHWRFPDGKA